MTDLEVRELRQELSDIKKVLRDISLDVLSNKKDIEAIPGKINQAVTKLQLKYMAALITSVGGVMIVFVQFLLPGIVKAIMKGV